MRNREWGQRQYDQMSDREYERAFYPPVPPPMPRWLIEGEEPPMSNEKIDAECAALDKACATGDHRIIKDGRCAWCRKVVLS